MSAIEATARSSNSSSSRLTLVVAASAAGTVFEWYDFFIFGSLAPIIGTHFYAGAGAAQGYIFALLTFAAGFAVRPFGALVFGRIGDRVGRKRAFLVTITIMGLSTVSVGLLPDAHTIGIGAAYILVGLRVLQGFAIGGQYGGAVIYVAEHARTQSRGTATGWIQVAASIGLLLALGVILLCRTNLGETAFRSWAWRIPFLFSAGLLGISIYIRLRLSESPMFRRIQEEGTASRAPIAETLFKPENLKIVIVALFSVLAAQGVVWYTAQFYTQFFLEGVIKVPGAVANELIMAATAASVPLYLFFARLSDLIGRKPIMLFGLGLACVSFVPGFKMLAEAGNPALVAASQQAPVFVQASPRDCAFQLDPLGKARFVSSCDVAKSALASLGIPYRNQAGTGKAAAHIQIGLSRGDSSPGMERPVFTLVSPDGRGRSATTFSIEKAKFVATLKADLSHAGYPVTADPVRVDHTRAFVLLFVFITAAAALYAPQAAALVELFPTRIRYTALSFPYHVGVGWFGGFLPVTAYAIVVATGNIYAGLWYPTVVAAIGFVVTLFLLPETRGRNIDL
jgi:MFS family permease